MDDDAEFTELIEFNLASQDCDILIAYNGLQALRIARTELPDVIVLDVVLPDIEGFTVCEILGADASTRDIPIFVLSALHESWTSMTKARFVRYFQKPVDLKLLGESVVTAAEKRQVATRSRPDHDPN